MKLLIGAIEYAVVVKTMEGEDVSEVELNTNNIFVHDKLPANQRSAAILHEVIHAMNWKIPENEVEYAAQAWYAFMINNKNFIKEVIGI